VKEVCWALQPNWQHKKQENDFDVLQVEPGTDANAIPDSYDKCNIALRYKNNMTSW